MVVFVPQDCAETEEVKQESSVEAKTEVGDGQVKSETATGVEVVQSGGETKQLDQSKTDCVVENSENNGTPSHGEVVTNTSEPLIVT